MPSIDIITHDDLAALLNRRTGVVVAEVLPESSWSAAHIPSAIHMPLAEVEAVAARVLTNKDTDVVLYCASETCQNSHIAARKLADLGYTHVHVFAGGKAAWKAAGLPLETNNVDAAAPNTDQLESTT
jgi:rhodanese-related sulfurtransferase